MTVNSKDSSARPAAQQEAAFTTIALQEIVKIETKHDLPYYRGTQHTCINQIPSYNVDKSAALLQIAKAENCDITAAKATANEIPSPARYDLAAAIATANLIQSPERK